MSLFGDQRKFIVYDLEASTHFLIVGEVAIEKYHNLEYWWIEEVY